MVCDFHRKKSGTRNYLRKYPRKFNLYDGRNAAKPHPVSA